jgi:hypothetical protein
MTTGAPHPIPTRAFNAEGAEVLAKAAKAFACAFFGGDLGVLCVESKGADLVAIIPCRMALCLYP